MEPSIYYDLRRDVDSGRLSKPNLAQIDPEWTLRRLYREFELVLWPKHSGANGSLPIRRLFWCCDALGWDRLASSITEADYETIARKLEKQGKAPGTVNRYFNAMNKLLKAGYRKRHPISGKRIVPELVEQVPWRKEPPGRSRYLADEEIPIVLSTLKRYPPNPKGGAAMAAYIRICLATGMRKSEVLSINPVDVHTDSVILRDTKTNEPRSIGIDQETRELLLKYLPWDEETTGSIQWLNYMYKVWSWLKIELGFEADKQFVPHTSRHTAASYMVEDDVNLRTIQHVLGHKHLTTTQRYTHVTNRASRNATGRLQSRLQKGGQ